MANQTFRADERLNELSDRDDMWGPLLFLRPERSRPMSPARVLVLSGLLGLFYGMLGNVVLALLAKVGPQGKPPVWLMPALLTAVYFVCAQLSVAAAWNRRARSILRRAGWLELTRRPAPPSDNEQADDEQAARK